MKVLMISTDARIAVAQSAEYKRMQSYATVTDELHIIVCTDGSQRLERLHEGNLSIYPTNSKSKWFYGVSVYSIAKELRSLGITIVTAQDPFETGLIGVFVARMLNVPLQVQVHTDFNAEHFSHTFKNMLRKIIVRYVIPKAGCIRVVSRRIQKALKEEFKLSYEPLVLPIHLDIPLTMLGERKSLLKHKYPQFARTILMVSRLEKEKNIEMALAAFHDAVKLFPGVGLVIVGGGSQEKRLRRLSYKSGLKNSVVFEGWQSSPIDYYLSADFFLNTSHYEGYGRTLMEAAVAGVPIITTDVGIVGEVLDEKSAFICDPKDKNGLTVQIEQALEDKQLAVEKALHAREAVTHYMSFTESDRLALFKRSWESCGTH